MIKRVMKRFSAYAVTAALTVTSMLSMPFANNIAKAATTGARSYIDSDGNVYLGGNYIEVGVSKMGSFGTSKAPDGSWGFHFVSGCESNGAYMGLLSCGDGWDNLAAPQSGNKYMNMSGDFFTPGSPYEAYMFTYKVNGTTRTCNVAERSGTMGTGVSWTDALHTSITSSGSTLSALTTGKTSDGVRINITYSFDVDDKFYLTNVEIKNEGSYDITDVHFVRNFDPDQDYWRYSTYKTYDKVVCNPVSTSEAGADNFCMVVSRGEKTLDGFFFLAFDNRARGYLGNMPSGSSYWASAPVTSKSYAEDEDIEMTKDALNGYRLEDARIGIGFNLGTVKAGASDSCEYFSSLDPNVSESLSNVLKVTATVTSTTITIPDADPLYYYGLFEKETEEQVRDWTDEVNEKGEIVFDNLVPNTSYTVKTILKTDFDEDSETQDPEKTGSTDIITGVDPLNPEDSEEEAPEIEITTTSHSVSVVNLNKTYTYNLLNEGGKKVFASYIAPQEDGSVEFTGLDAGTSYYLVAKVGDNANSDKVETKTLYEVKYNANGYGVAPETVSNISLDGNTKLTKPADPEDLLHGFDGWYTTSTCEEGSEWDFANDTVTGNVTLYAKWVDHVHKYNRANPKIRWASDYSYATFSVDCDEYSTCEHTETLVDDALTSETTADCVTEGEITYKAAFSFGGKKYEYQTTVDAEPLGHNMECHESVAPSCEDEGSEEYFSCLRCGKLFADSEGDEEVSLEDTVVEALGHDSIKKLPKAATCSVDGNKLYWHCKVCDKNFLDSFCEVAVADEDIIIEATGHRYSDTVTERTATCTTPGNIAYAHCLICGDAFKVSEDLEGNTVYTLLADDEKLVTKALGHSYTEESVKPEALINAATCTKPAVYHKSCSRCGAVSTSLTQKFESGTPLNHTMTKTTGTPATCTTSGVKDYWTCSVCGKMFDDNNDYTVNEISAPVVLEEKGHTFTKKAEKPETLVADETCESGAIYRYSCEDCDVQSSKTFESETRTKLFHNYEVSFTWTKAHDKCTAEFVCANCGDTKVYEAFEGDENFSVEPLSAHMCTSPGALYVATFTPELINVPATEIGRTFEASETVSTKTVGHKFTSYSSNDDASCEIDGTKTALCDYGCGEVDTISDDGTATGHDYDEPVIEWNDAATQCTFTFVCKNDGTHKVVKNTSNGVAINLVSQTQASCLADGERTYKAAVSFEGEEFTDTKQVIDVKLGHSLTHVSAVDQTCEAAGNIEYWKCTLCNKFLATNSVNGTTEIDEVNNDGVITSADAVRPALGHDYNIVVTDGDNGIVWAKNDAGKVTASAAFVCANDSEHTATINAIISSEVTTLATCTEKGERTYTATVSFGGKTYTDTCTEEIPVTEHSWTDDFVTDVEPSCDEDGSKSIHCTKCSATKYSTSISKVGHDYKLLNDDGEEKFNWIVDEDDNVTAVARFVCANDAEHVVEQEVPLKVTVNQEVSCLEDGNKAYEGTILFAGALYSDSYEQVIAAKGHSWGEPVITEATCTKAGKKVYTCQNGCGMTKRKTIAKLGHSFTVYVDDHNATILQDGTETAKCDRGCGATDTRVIPGSKEQAEGVSDEEKERAILALNKGLIVEQTGSKLGVTWGEVTEATGYKVYVTYCGEKYKNPITVKGSSKTTLDILKINGSKLILDKNYKLYVVAYKTVNGKQYELGRTITGHVVGRLNKKYSNPKKIILSKKKITLAVGGKETIKAEIELVNPKKKMLGDAHAKTFRYASTNKNVAIVSSKGVITAKSKGKCEIYVYAKNGYAEKISITVK